MKVNKIAFILLAAFVGDFGLHRFYTHKFISGFFYLLFCWTGIPHVIAIIEAIIAACTEADENGMIEK